MTVKTILVPLADVRSGKPALHAAVAAARHFAAHVQALHVRPDPRMVVLDYASESVSGAMVDRVIKSAEARATKDAKAARKLFDDVCKAEGLPVIDKAPGPNGVSASWREEMGYEDRWVEAHGRTSDLVVVGRPASTDVASRLSLETALIETGRPVLIATAKGELAFGGTVAIAWKDTAESARALGASLPFLTAARKVVIVTAAEDGTGPDKSPEAVQSYLAWHGVKAGVERLKPKGEVGAAILSAAAKVKADLLVMGAYGHSRVREMILGGVTRHVLEAGTLPALMAH